MRSLLPVFLLPAALCLSCTGRFSEDTHGTGLLGIGHSGMDLPSKPPVVDRLAPEPAGGPTELSEDFTPKTW